MAKKTILIVEDEKMLSDAYQAILKKEGYKVDAAYDGEEALKKAKDHEPDLILLDLRMPNMSGIEFLNKYKPLKKHPNVKIIVFSNLDTQKEINEAYELGAHKYMLKAWASPKELARFVENTLAGK
ncbi:MAG TPA: response regulator [Candidatus Saccharimonadales bacterium]|nr:response regulator [Candidatus Saccharimonadales bacterium]